MWSVRPRFSWMTRTDPRAWRAGAQAPWSVAVGPLKVIGCVATGAQVSAPAACAARPVAAAALALVLSASALEPHAASSVDAVATRHGADRIARVALISPTLPYLRRDESNPDGVDPALFEQIVAALRADRPGYLADLGPAAMGLGLPGVEVSSALMDWALGLFMSSSPKASIDTVRTHTATDLRDDMASFVMPTLIVHGDRDALVPIEVSGRRAAEMIPESTLVVYENASHWPFVTHRERLNEELGAFARAEQPVST
jgi:pimeloyl-ACP methyl ester carboxylesterase